jgi:hypothetical protein
MTINGLYYLIFKMNQLFLSPISLCIRHFGNFVYSSNRSITRNSSISIQSNNLTIIINYSINNYHKGSFNHLCEDTGIIKSRAFSIIKYYTRLYKIIKIIIKKKKTFESNVDHILLDVQTMVMSLIETTR